MKYPILLLPFLKLVVLQTINNWCSFLISTFAVSNIANRFKDHHILDMFIVHHEALAAWWQWLWRTIIVSSGRLTPTWFKRLSYSDNLSTRSTIELFSFTLWTKNLVGGLVPLNKGTSMKSQFHLFRTSLMFRDVSKRLRCLASKPLSILHRTIA